MSLASWGPRVVRGTGAGQTVVSGRVRKREGVKRDSTFVEARFVTHRVGLPFHGSPLCSSPLTP
jgi:hypothetical protein